MEEWSRLHFTGLIDRYFESGVDKQDGEPMPGYENDIMGSQNRKIGYDHYEAYRNHTETVMKEKGYKNAFLNRGVIEDKMTSPSKTTNPRAEMKIKYIKAIVVLIVTAHTFFACQNNKGTTIIESSGFIVFDNPDYWIFLPTKELNQVHCERDFINSNLETGLALGDSDIPNFSLLKRTLDTLQIIDVGHNHLSYKSSLKYTPVEIKYELDSKFVGAVSPLRGAYKGNTGQKQVFFSFDTFPLKVIDLVPLYCGSIKQNDISEIDCVDIGGDQDGYLSKICQYIKQKDRYSDLPDKYRIKHISFDSLENRPVIKVELTCCYMGDVAYFDTDSKELLKMHFGAK